MNRRQIRAGAITRRNAIGLIGAGLASLAAADPVRRFSGPPSLRRSDQDFLEDVSARAFHYFWEQTDSITGLVLDRARTDGDRAKGKASNVASIAATGFGLTALAIGADRNWIGEDEAFKRARTTLRFFHGQAMHERGWFYHFMDATTGERAYRSEVSSIDTALLLAGILTAGERFRDPEISWLASEVYDRVDFPWMLDGDSNLLSHGWTPETGFLKYRWDRFCELPLLYLLAIGARWPIPASAWYAWKRPTESYAGFTWVNGPPPLFAQQYPQAWVDMRSMRDADPSGLDYFQNSITATRAHRAFCIDLAPKFPKSYSENVWGITAADGPAGYVEWKIDGTVVPCAPGGSLMFAPDICVPALRTMQERFGEKTWGRYGFCDAFNPTTGWIDTDVLGIDQGIILLSAENLRGGKVWSWFMRNPAIPNALELCRFRREPDSQGDRG
ncbi:MAG TPA: glucoamylase family protein [Bryobacteraceae bacterium]|nr:glucoamylase family protein [Bryobacteraceae bacterium]